MEKDGPCTVETETVRDVLGSIADKWTLLVLDELEDRTLRFSELQRTLGRVSQKVLTQTLREMERNGFVSRRVYPTVPPKVEYALTPMGHDLGAAICGVWRWTAANYPQVVSARQAFDDRPAADSGPVVPPPLRVATEVVTPTKR